MSIVQSLYNKVVRNEDITRTEALRLYSQPLAELCTAADEIRKLFCEDNFDICTIFSAKSGNCSENCKSSIKLKRIMKMVLHAIP